MTDNQEYNFRQLCGNNDDASRSILAENRFLPSLNVREFLLRPPGYVPQFPDEDANCCSSHNIPPVSCGDAALQKSGNDPSILSESIRYIALQMRLPWEREKEFAKDGSENASSRLPRSDSHICCRDQQVSISALSASRLSVESDGRSNQKLDVQLDSSEEFAVYEWKR